MPFFHSSQIDAATAKRRIAVWSRATVPRRAVADDDLLEGEEQEQGTQGGRQHAERASSDAPATGLCSNRLRLVRPSPALDLHAEERAA